VRVEHVTSAYNKKDLVIAISAFLMWGVLPVYWKQLKAVSAMEILAHRIIWSLVFLLLVLLGSRKFKPFVRECIEVFRDKKRFSILVLSAVFLNINWLTYIWAVNHDYIVQTSLGYYINPILSVFLGLIVLKERLSTLLWISFSLILLGVMMMVFKAGIFPWIGLILAFSFALYGLLKKLNPLPAISSLTLETLISSAPSIGYLLFIASKGQSSFFQGFSSIQLFLMGGGAVTALPLIFFSMGAKRLPLYMIGFFQYIGPSIALFLGVFLYHETFSLAHLLSFSLVWLGLTVFSLNVYRQLRNAKIDRLN
jgi:chloramphenicol-sensitive protein RarD